MRKNSVSSVRIIAISRNNAFISTDWTDAKCMFTEISGGRGRERDKEMRVKDWFIRGRMHLELRRQRRIANLRIVGVINGDLFMETRYSGYADGTFAKVGISITLPRRSFDATNRSLIATARFVG